MMKLYYDSDFKLHMEHSDDYTVFETDAFDDKCKEYIEGFRYVPEGAVWLREDGTKFHGMMCVPWKPYHELDAAQREYEKQLLIETQNEKEELMTSYADGVNSI